MERVAVTRSSGAGTEADPVLLEIFNNLFMSIAEQMGARLESTAQSVNIKERLDFSCALFDPDGNLVANAPHIPVHLGSMGTSVKEVIRRRGASMRPGDTYAVVDPYHGGTHLPDVTVVTPVFGTPRTARHPRSSSTSPPAATTPRSAASPRLHAREQPHHRRGRRSLRQLAAHRERPVPRGGDPPPAHRGAPPSRNPATNLADLRAQIAANHKGASKRSAA